MSFTEEFICELLKSSLVSREMFEVLSTHLEDDYLPIEEWKNIWKYIKEEYELTDSTPTIGVLNERVQNEKEKEFLLKLKNTIVYSEQRKPLLIRLEKFIKNTQFKSLYKQVGQLYNQGEHDSAIDLLSKKSSEIQQFSLLSKTYTTVFQGFSSRIVERTIASLRGDSEEKIPFGIPPLDYYTYGGGNKGTSALFLGRSGAGKSTALRWIGVNAARLGYRVVHFQLEGTKKECLESYDASWTGIKVRDIEKNNIPEDILPKLEKVNKSVISSGGEIYVVASETFDSISIEEARNTLYDITKNSGPIDLVLFDYLELFQTKKTFENSDKGERRKREYIANKITNIAVELNLFSVTATQANDIPVDKWNNPEFVMTRSDISEFKGAIKPFSYFITLNQTIEESKLGIMRLHNDKLRKYKGGQTYFIAQSFDNSRFCDIHKTYKLFWDQQTNKPKK